MEREFDVVVVGGGPAGEIAAGRLGKRGGKSVALVERHLVGGECSYYACMPSKALLRPQQALDEIARVPGAREAAGREPDVPAALARRDEVIHDLDDSGQLPWLESNGIELIREGGRLDGERRVRAGDDILIARDAVIVAVGTGAALPPIPGLAEADPWTNREATTASEVPERLVVLGGGVVGVEMAQAWRTLGSEVAVIEALDRLIPREEEYASRELADAFEKLGIEVHTGCKATKVERGGDGVTVELEDGTTVSGDTLLAAVGRHPLTDDLGLETVGLEPGGSIEVDRDMRVPGHDWLYAIGDVNGRSLLTHSGKYQGRLAADRILGESVAAISDDSKAPRVVFTEPQVAAVGYTLEGARDAGIAAEAIDLNTSGTAGASFHGRNEPGTTRFVVDTERDVLVGVTFVGVDVSDMLQAATIAVVGQVPLQTLAHAIAPFPTRSELWLKFIEADEERRANGSLHASSERSPGVPV